MKFISENWGIIMSAVGILIWMVRLQSAVHSLQKETFVTNERCIERRIEITKLTDLEFRHGNEQFKEIKKMITANDQASINRHQELMNILMNIGRE